LHFLFGTAVTTPAFVYHSVRDLLYVGMVFKRCALAVLLAAGILAEGFGESPQRARMPAPPASAPKGPNPIDSLGLFQPESVRSILLLYLARNISKPKVNELEAEVKKNPENIDARLSLIGFYSWNAQTSVNMARLRTHVLWLIENHPEHPATGEPSLRDLPDDPDGNVRILALWTKNIESRGSEYDVLRNAEKFFFSRDPVEAERILNRLFEKDPVNREWPAELSKLYAMFGIPNFQSDDPAEKAEEAYRRVLKLTRDPRSREALAGDMAESEFKIGDYTGAAALAQIHLHSADRSAVQRANTLLGRIALRSNDMSAAKQRLLDSAGPDAAKYVGLAGPTMVLAKELLEKGERQVVMEYLENCLVLWPRGDDLLNLWISEIRSGRTPDFGNLGL
jgi:tetratricopeptide (TPR) repeat protein